MSSWQHMQKLNEDNPFAHIRGLVYRREGQGQPAAPPALIDASTLNPMTWLPTLVRPAQRGVTGIVRTVGKIGKLPGMAVGLVMGEGEHIEAQQAPDQGVDAANPAPSVTISGQSDDAERVTAAQTVSAQSAPTNPDSVDTSTDSVVRDLPFPRCASADQSGMEALLRCPPQAATGDRPFSLYGDEFSGRHTIG